MSEVRPIGAVQSQVINAPMKTEDVKVKKDFRGPSFEDCTKLYSKEENIIMRFT